jgi:hypothetical protein
MLFASSQRHQLPGGAETGVPTGVRLRSLAHSPAANPLGVTVEMGRGFWGYRLPRLGPVVTRGYEWAGSTGIGYAR